MNAKLTDSTVTHLENPWSKEVKTMTWREIKEWAEKNVHPNDRHGWIRAARAAVKKGDAKTLGSMVIGS